MVRALAVAHLVVSAAAIIMVALMLFAGSQPNAELEGLFLVAGLVLAIPTAAFTAAAMHCARLCFRDPPEGLTWSALLGGTEAVLGVAFVGGIALSSAPTSSPLVVPTVILLVLGPMTVWMTRVKA